MLLNTNEITFEHHGDVTLFDIRGDITSFSEPFVNDAYRSASDQGARKILLKIGKDTYINSGGIAILINLLAQSQKNKQLVGIAGVSSHYRKILSMVGITKFAEIHDSVESALDVMAKSD